MNLSIKALLPEVEVPAEEVDAKKGKKNTKEEVVEEPELREWKDSEEGSVSIAEMISNND